MRLFRRGRGLRKFVRGARRISKRATRVIRKNALPVAGGLALGRVGFVKRTLDNIGNKIKGLRARNKNSNSGSKGKDGKGIDILESLGLGSGDTNNNNGFFAKLSNWFGNLVDKLAGG